VVAITLQLRLITPAADIVNNILQRWVTDLNRRINTSVFRSTLKREVGLLIRNGIIAQPEYGSLATIGDKLNTEIGLLDAESKLRSLIDIWVRSVEVVMTPPSIVGSRIVGNVVLRAVHSDFADVLGAKAAKYITEKGDEIPWLEWLLLHGNNIIMATHNAVYIPDAVAWSRTGHDIMVKGSGWRVPPEFSGTINNNFITRAIDNILSDVRVVVEREIRSKLGL
jgi:hypothetical protein